MKVINMIVRSGDKNMGSGNKEFGQFIHGDFIEQELKFSNVYRILEKYENKNTYNIEKLTGNPEVNIDCTIWLMWMQGLDEAPEVIKKCCDSIYKNKPDNFTVIFLTKHNINDYITLPDYIWKKYNEGIITTTHLSDIIRVELLATYGGCWIDATVFSSGSIPSYMLSDMFMFKLNSVLTVPVIKMSSWWLAADRKNRIIHSTRHILHEYWKNEVVLCDYYLLHIIMSKVIDEDSACRAVFQNIPFFNSANAQVLIGKLESQYSKEQWNIIKNISLVQKLTYKKRHIKGDVYSYYMALLDGKLD